MTAEQLYNHWSNVLKSYKIEFKYNHIIHFNFNCGLRTDRYKFCWYHNSISDTNCLLKPYRLSLPQEEKIAKLFCIDGWEDEKNYVKLRTWDMDFKINDRDNKKY